MSSLRHQRASRRARRAGFTLVEMMVAMTIGGLLVASVYTMSASSSREFQEQQRLTEIQLSTRLALDRVRRDVERAALHSVADSASARMGQTPATRMVGIVLTDNDAGSRAAINSHQAGAANTTTQADLLRLTGNFVTSDSYLVANLSDAGNSATLQTSWQGFRRSFSDTVSDPSGNTIDAARFAQVFAPGRMVHLRNPQGYHFIAQITGTTVTGGTAVVAFTPSMPIGSAVMSGRGEQSLIAPISTVEYSLRSAPPDLPVSPNVAVTGPDVALVRRELANGGAVITQRTVLEYAVHFDVDAIMDTTPLGTAPNSQSFTLANDAAAQAQVAASPGRVRGLRVSLGARSRIQDAEFPWVAPVAGAPLTRFRVFSDRAGAARVRVATMEIGVPNMLELGF